MVKLIGETGLKSSVYDGTDYILLNAVNLIRIEYDVKADSWHIAI